MVTGQITNSRLSSLKGVIDFKKNYVLTLKKRLVLIKKDFVLKDEFQKNEIDVITYQTLSLISHANHYIHQKEAEFQHESELFYKDLEELECSYTNVIEEAQKQQSNNVELKHILYHVNWKYVNENIDEKIHLYKNLKQQLV